MVDTKVLLWLPAKSVTRFKDDILSPSSQESQVKFGNESRFPWSSQDKNLEASLAFESLATNLSWKNIPRWDSLSNAGAMHHHWRHASPLAPCMTWRRVWPLAPCMTTGAVYDHWRLHDHWRHAWPLAPCITTGAMHDHWRHAWLLAPFMTTSAMHDHWPIERQNKRRMNPSLYLYNTFEVR
jgi:hypothetical protein